MYAFNIQHNKKFIDNNNHNIYYARGPNGPIV